MIAITVAITAIALPPVRTVVEDRFTMLEVNHVVNEADEFRLLVPLCHECHDVLRIKGPAVPNEIPEGVKQWL